MPALDRDHSIVKRALIQGGWIVTDDPLRLRVGTRDLYVDLGAEQLLAAQKGTRKIAVEVKTFRGLSDVRDLEAALGQFVLYRDILAEQEPDREVFVAVTIAVAQGILQEELGKLILRRGTAQFLVYNAQEEIIVQWLP